MGRLAGVVTGCKIGTQLFTGAGPAAVEAARKRGLRVFLDLKFHDIPNTVAGAVREATRLGVFMLNVHASCVGVTVLTSLDRAALEREMGVTASVPAHVLRLAERAREAGLDGCVASPQEIRMLRIALGVRWVIVTPGIRTGPAEGDSRPPHDTPGSRRDDQVRVATPRQARAAGADYLVVGRPITAAPDPAAAAREILSQLR